MNRFPHSETMEIISINNNNLTDADGAVKNIREKFPNLRSVSTLRNPMNPGIQSPEYSNYRQKFYQISSLKFLDGIDIKSTEKKTKIDMWEKPKEED